MILDTSAIVAILRLEPEARVFADLIERSDVIRVSTATVVETALVLGPQLDTALDEFLEVVGARIETVTPAQLTLARVAHRRFGRGSGHPARLNFGDCFSYALAKERVETLLFKGADFAHTDITGAA